MCKFLLHTLPFIYVVIFIVNSSSGPHDVGNLLQEHVVISLNDGYAVFLKLEQNGDNYWQLGTIVFHILSFNY